MRRIVEPSHFTARIMGFGVPLFLFFPTLPGTAQRPEQRCPMRSHALAWLLLVASIVAEVAGTIALRYADGFTRLLPSLVVGSLYALAIWLMSMSVRHLEVGLAYAVWAGVGTALTALVGIVWFGEASHAARVIGIAFIVLGVVCLNLDWR